MVPSHSNQRLYKRIVLLILRSQTKSQLVIIIVNLLSTKTVYSMSKMKTTTSLMAHLFLLNLDEFYANDMDRDGFNTTDAGDGIIDACPNIPGNSTQDRMGCIDKDGDGWSNQYEFEQDVQDSGFFDDPTQWNDTDRDGFGDNPLGNNGDKCPLYAAIDSVDGCPDDTDEDGVFDMEDNCPDTARS